MSASWSVPRKQSTIDPKSPVALYRFSTRSSSILRCDTVTINYATEFSLKSLELWEPQTFHHVHSSIEQVFCGSHSKNLFGRAESSIISSGEISYSQIYFKLALGDGASVISRDNNCATCHEFVFLKLLLAFFSNTTRFYFNLEVICL